MFGCLFVCDLAACDRDTNSPSESHRRRRGLIQKRRAEQPEKASASPELCGGVTEVTVVVLFFFLCSYFFSINTLQAGSDSHSGVVKTRAAYCQQQLPGAFFFQVQKCKTCAQKSECLDARAGRNTSEGDPASCFGPRCLQLDRNVLTYWYDI